MNDELARPSVRFAVLIQAPLSVAEQQLARIERIASDPGIGAAVTFAERADSMTSVFLNVPDAAVGTLRGQVSDDLPPGYKAERPTLMGRVVKISPAVAGSVPVT